MHTWLTLDKSASYLSYILNEPVVITDLYRLALDKKLTLSVRFLESVPALLGELIDEDDYYSQVSGKDSEECYFDSSDVFIPEETRDCCEAVNDNTIFIYEDFVQHIQGVWDLTMVGLESVDIEKRYLYELGECDYSPRRYAEQGVFVRNDDGVCKLLKKIVPSPLYEDQAFVGGIMKNFLQSKLISYDKCVNQDFETLASLLTPAQLSHVATIIEFMSESLPSDKLYQSCLTIEDSQYQFVIRKQEIDRFVLTLSDTQQDPSRQYDSLEPNEERAKFLLLINVLCNKIKVDPKRRGITASLVAMVELSSSSLSDDTIREIIKQIDPVVDPKSKVRITRTLTTKEKKSFLVLIKALCAVAKLDYKDQVAIEALVNMSKMNGTPLLSVEISDLLNQIDAAV